MASGEPKVSPESLHTPLACEKCGRPAKLASTRIDAFSRGLRETWTYVCASCGHGMDREVDRDR
jgi:hypothetical protein